MTRGSGAFPYPSIEGAFSALPVPGTIARHWYFGPKGTLNDQPATVKGVDTYTADANATPRNDFTGPTEGKGLWGNASQWSWNWVQSHPGSAVSYHTLIQMTDAKLLARAQVWAATSPNCANEGYNVTNGDCYRWEQIWPRLAEFFGMKVADLP